MSQRFFTTDHDGTRAELAGPEAHHLLHVMRAEAGDELTLFDGTGHEYRARISRCGRSSVELEIIERHSVDRESPLGCTLAVALPKGDRQAWLVEKAVELGVRRLVPLVTMRGVAQPVDKALERLRRTVIEASKQSGRNRLMEITPAQTLAEVLASTTSVPLRWIAHPGGVSLGDASLEKPTEAIVAIGPEGGFTAEEVAQATATHWQSVSLGGRYLRIETAAIAVASWLLLGAER